MMMPQKLSYRIYAITALCFILASVTIILFVNRQMRREALLEAETKARILLDRALATHTYFSRQLKPALFNLTDAVEPDTYFEPVWMSSTYAVRRINDYFETFSHDQYYYKECAINARSPENEADASEVAFIRALNRDKALTVRTAKKDIAGSPYFIVLRRGEVMEKACLRCHSTPSRAPEDMVRIYGPDRSFNRKVGEVVSAISIRIPLGAAYASANRLSARLSFMSVLALFLLYIVSWLSSRYALFKPLRQIQEKADQIASDPDRLGEHVPVPHGQELRELAETFNRLLAQLRLERNSLEEKVKDETAKLALANRELSQEIKERQRVAEALRESEQWFRNIYEKSPIGIGLYDSQGQLFQVNDACLNIFGIVHTSEIIGFSLFDDPNLSASHQTALHAGEPVQYEAPYDFEIVKRHRLYAMTKSGTIFLDVRLTPLPAGGGRIGGYLAQVVDITARERAQRALADSEERLKLALDAVSDAVWDWRVDSGEIYCSPNWYRMLGYEPDEKPQALDRWVSLIHSEDLPDARQTVYRHLNSGEPFQVEYRWRTRDGQWKWVLGRGKTVETDRCGQAVRMLGTHMDITARKQYESEREITIHLLQALHKENGLSELVRDVTRLMQNWSGCEAAGVRLLDGKDYPYFETRGFPTEFVESENRLCALDENGQPICDSTGNPTLECMCGNVLCGRFDPGRPFFTPNGSFFTNSTTALLSATTEADRQARTRNRCHGEGYESVALIPLTAGRQKIGLLQFNDSRPNRFEQDTIELLERLAASLAIGLSQRMTGMALRKSETRLRSLYDNAPIGIFRTNSKGAVIAANPAMARILGLDSPEAVLAHYSDLGQQLYLKPEVRRQFIALLRSAGHVENHEYRAKSADGRHIWLSMNARIAAMHPDGTFEMEGFATDVTARKQADHQLIERERYLSTILDTIAEGFWLADTEGRIIDANASYRRMSGYRLDELTRMTINDIDALEAPSETAARIARVMEKGPELFETRHRRKDGSLFDVEMSITYLKGDEDRLIEFCRDISERREAEAERANLQMRLQQAQRMESIGNLAGGIAHDFNNILFPIIGMSEMLLEDFPSGSQVHENVQYILKAGKRGSELVKQILAFSRQSEHRMVPVRIQQVLKEVLKLTRATIPSNIRMIHEIQTDCGMVLADATQIHQIAMNLITNAYHAVEPAGGRIAVMLQETEWTADDWADSRLDPGPYALLSITDNGCGIAPAIVDKIFDPYFTTKQKGKGTGLGLAVVYGIVKEHGGDIKVESEPGRGTTCKVYLPLMRQCREDAAVAPENPLQTGHERILLVDDEQEVARMEGEMLQRLGYQVTLRIHSLEALEAFRSNPDAYDLVITDMSMPNMTGDQLARAVMTVRPDIPVVICTGFSERITPDRAAAMGIQGFLMKPVLRSDMADMIRKVLDEGRAKP